MYGIKPINMTIRAVDISFFTVVFKYIKCLLFTITLLFSFNIKAQITTFPYTEDFESGPSGWLTQGNTSWELGIPSTPIINSAASGSNAWVTNLDGNYSVNEDGWLQSPVFDFSALSIPEIQFAIWWNCEEQFDGVVLQSSINSGSTWENVGNFGDFNWFTHQFIDASPGGQGDGWSGHEENFTGSEGWRIVANDLSNLIGQSNVIFRLAFASDSGVNDEGIGFDLIKIYDGDCNAGDNQNLSECYTNSDIIDLNAFLSFDASTTGSWEVVEGDVTINGNEVDMANVDADDYIFRYTVTNGSCIDSADIFITIEKSLDAGENGELVTCSPFTNDDLFNALNGSPDPGGVWTQISTDPNIFMYEHPAVDSCPASSAIVTVNTTGSNSFDVGEEEEPCYIFETVSLNDYLPDDIPDTGGTWTFLPPASDPEKDVPIREGDDVDFPDTGAGEVAYNFNYDVTQDCDLYTFVLTVNVVIDPFPDAGEDKTVNLYCDNYSSLNLNQFVTPNLIATHNITWESLDGLTIQGEDEVSFPDNGPGQFLYTFNYTKTNSCGQEDSAVIEFNLELLDQPIIIPDSEFERYLIDAGIDANPVPDGEIPFSNVCDVYDFDIFEYDISDFEGLQYFTSLEDFYLTNNLSAVINPIDFSGNPFLNIIEIQNSPNLTQVDINENVRLTNLKINTESNLFDSIDTSNNINLTSLDLKSSGIASLDLSNNGLIQFLNISDNPINEIDVSNLLDLTVFQVRDNQMLRLDLSNNTALFNLLADFGNLESVNLNSGFNENLDTIILDFNPNLSCIYVDDIANALAETNWTKDASASYVDTPVISIDTPAQDESSTFFESFETPVNLDIDAFNIWLNSNGGAVASSSCGTVTWSYSYDVSYNDIENTVSYVTTFVAYDGFEYLTTAATFTFDNVYVSAGGDFIFESEAGIDGGTRCGNDDFSLSIIDGFYIQYNDTEVPFEFTQTEGPEGASFMGAVVDFPDTGAGQFLYSFDFERSLDVEFPDISVQLSDEAIVTFWVVVPFDVGEDGTLEICQGQNVSLDDLYNALEGTPNLEGSNFDMEDLWSPSVYSGPGVYTFDFSQVAPECNFDSSTVTVTEITCNTNLINLSVFLEGAYDTNTGLMRDDMRASGILPTVSPYADALNCDASVFNTTGNTAIIDWVWVELRATLDPTSVMQSRSGFLRADGSIVDVDGFSPLSIYAPTDDYYIMISHRNHLGVLTANTYTFDGTTLNVDLTTSNLLVQGANNAISNFGDGSYGLYAGDFNGDGQIQNTDRNGVVPLRGISGYNNADINLNGEVQNNDINGILTPNIGKGEQFMSRNLFAPRQQN